MCVLMVRDPLKLTASLRLISPSRHSLLVDSLDLHLDDTSRFFRA